MQGKGGGIKRGKGRRGERDRSGEGGKGMGIDCERGEGAGRKLCLGGGESGGDDG